MGGGFALQVELGGKVGIGHEGRAVEGARLGRLARLGLAYLVCERHRPVSRDELAEALWGEALPGSWEQMVRGVVSSLRALLRDCGLEATEVLATVHGCYQMSLPAGVTVDIEVAASTLAAARVELAAGDAEAAQRGAAEVVTVASRQFLPGASGTWVERRQAEVRDLHLGGLEVMAQAAESRGRWAEGIAAAEEALAIEPFRESAYLRLMAGHAGAGHRGEALQAYERCRRSLGEELGVSPSAATEAAYLALLGDEPSPVPTANATAPPPLPSPLTAIPGRILVGRHAALESLVEAFTRSHADRRAVFIGGEPGVGKTALVAALAREVHDRGARVLYGRCDEGLSVAYQAFGEAIGHLVATVPLSALEGHAASHGAELARVTAEFGRRLPDCGPPAVTDPEADRYRLFEAVADLLSSAAASAPVVLVLDDLHWGASPTLLLLRHLLRAGGKPGLLLLATYRHTELSDGHPLTTVLADLHRAPGVERLMLEGLDEDGVAAFVQAADGGSLGEAAASLARALHAHTSGNPFFVGELLRHMAESGATYRREAGWTYWADASGRDIPESVREVVARRLGRLSGAANRVLTVAAVVGYEFDLDIVERVVDPGEADAALDATEEALSAHLIEETKPGRYRFSHALVRDAMCAGLSAMRRARLHRRVGEVLEVLPHADVSRVPALAHHFAEAAPAGCAAKACDYALAAARQAFATAAWEGAISHLERGLVALETDPQPDQERRCDLLILLAEAWTRFFNPERTVEVAEQAVDAARRVGSAERLGQATYWYVRAAVGVPRRPDVDERATATARQALAALGDAMPSLKARILARRPAARPDQDTETTLREALAMARESGDPDAVGVALAMLTMVLNSSPQLEEYLAVTDELVRTAPANGWDGWRDGLTGRAIARLFAGDRDGFEADVAACRRFGVERGFWFFGWISEMWQVTLALLDGRFGEVEAGRAVALSERKSGARELEARQLFRLRFERGDRHGALEFVTSAIEEHGWNVTYVARRALALAELDLEGSRQELELFANQGPAEPMSQSQAVVVLAHRAEVAAALGTGARAAPLYAEYLPWAGQLVVGGTAEVPYGAVDRYLGMLATEMGRWKEAAVHFDSALALEAGLRSPPLVARTQFWYGRLLLGRGWPGDSEKAAGLLAASGETAARLGMIRLAEQVTVVAAGE